MTKMRFKMREYLEMRGYISILYTLISKYHDMSYVRMATRMALVSTKIDNRDEVCSDLINYLLWEVMTSCDEYELYAVTQLIERLNKYADNHAYMLFCVYILDKEKEEVHND